MNKRRGRKSLRLPVLFAALILSVSGMVSVSLAVSRAGEQKPAAKGPDGGADGSVDAGVFHAPVDSTNGDVAPTSAPEGKLSFLVIGDWGRRGHYHQRDVAEQMARTAREDGAMFVISTGDNIYNSGVKSVHDRLWKLSFENVYTQPELQIPWYVVLGNHDWRGNWRAQIAYSSVSDRWTLPDVHYTVHERVDDSTALDLFFIDTNLMIHEYRGSRLYDALKDVHPAETEAAWLDSALAASTATWKVVVGHHPIYSSGHHGPTEDVKKHVEPLLKRYDVQAYFDGHEHDMQHQDPETGTQYFVSGAGSEVRRAGVNETTRFAYGRTSGFMAVTVYADSMHVDAIGYRGDVLYGVTLDGSGTVVSGGKRTVHRGRWFPPW